MCRWRPEEVTDEEDKEGDGDQLGSQRYSAPLGILGFSGVTPLFWDVPERGPTGMALFEFFC